MKDGIKTVSCGKSREIPKVELHSDQFALQKKRVTRNTHSDFSRSQFAITGANDLGYLCATVEL